MRRLTFYIIAAALAFSASCSKQEAETAPAQKEQEYKTILYATFDEGQTKTWIDEKNKPHWVIDDEIWISNGETATSAKVTAVDETTGKATLETSLEGTTFYAVYPYRVNPNTTEETPDADRYPYSVNDDGTIIIDIPILQSGKFKDANICAAVCGAGGTLKFKNATSLFKITSKLPSVTAIKCSHKGIAGKVKFDYNKGEKPIVTPNEEEVKTITVDLSPEIVVANPDLIAPYYIAVAPEIEYSDIPEYNENFAIYSVGKTDKYSKKVKSKIKLLRSKIYNLGFAGPEGGTPGEFTINGNGDKVCFAKGNFYAYRTSTTSDTWTYAMYDQQYIVTNERPLGDYGGYNKDFGSTLTELYLFSWGSSNTKITYRGNNAETCTDFLDWGDHIGDGQTWRTLSKAEWSYIVDSRSYTNRYAAVTIQYDASTNIMGLLLFPDAWSGNYPSIKEINYCTNYSTNTISLDQWKELEEQGVVFLPRGFLIASWDTTWANAGEEYWANNMNTSSAGFRFSLTGVSTPGDAAAVENLYMIRLVSDINKVKE